MSTVENTTDVKLVRWPAEADRRDHYRTRGVLRLLVVEGWAAPPISGDVREDWVRAPVTDNDLRARIATLQAKARAFRSPKLDANGVLRYRGQLTTLSRTETDLLARLVRDFGQTVDRDELTECLPDRPIRASRNALDLHILRLRKRVAPVGLGIRTVWGRGYLLEPQSDRQAAGAEEQESQRDAS